MLECFSLLFLLRKQVHKNRKEKKNDVDTILQLKRESYFIHFSFMNSGSHYPVDLHPEKKTKTYCIHIFVFIIPDENKKI